LDGLSVAVLGLCLLAAVAHAAWNLLAKGAQGGQGFVWLYTVSASVLYLPALVVALIVAPGPLGVAAFVLMAGSGALHTVYASLLQRGYRTGDLSLVYPLARGTGPLISTVLAIVIYAERPSPVALAGAGMIVIAVLALARPTPGMARETHRTAAGLAVLTGVAIAGYTLWDKHAVDALALSPLVYYWGTNTANAILLTALIRKRRGAVRLAWSTSRSQALGVALLSPLAYVLILFALARAPVSAVAPARELSILIGTLLGTTVLAEGDGARRAVASAAIVAGVVALALG
jgi:drug/metabolite transporter (DMT)-like permease